MMIDNGGIALHVSDDGEADAPPVLLLHGILGSGDTWNFIVPVLAKRFRVLRLDFRGHGKSQRAPGAYLFADYVSDAVAVCEQVARRACTVIGHSLGGGTAAGLAQQRPDLVNGLVFEDPALLSDSDREDFDTNALAGVFTLLRQGIPVVQAQSPTVTDLAAMMATMPSTSGEPMGEVYQPDALLAMATAQLAVDATVLDPVLDGSLNNPFDFDRPIPVRGLVLAADPAMPDCVARPSICARLVRTSPLITVRVIEHAGHLIHDSLAHRGTFTQAVLDFLET